MPRDNELFGQVTPALSPAADRPRSGDLWTRVVMAWLEALQIGRLTLVLPDGTTRHFDGRLAGGPQAVLNVIRPRAFRRLVLGGSVGFAEAYIDGDWTSPDLTSLIELAAFNDEGSSRCPPGLRAARLAHRLRHVLRPNTRRGSRRNIARHYDLGNAFFAAWLDEGLTYSSALFETPALDLEQAQAAKYRQLARLLDLGPGHHVLEIGCGWGGFAEFAVKECQCRVTAVTVSREQFDHARKRIFDAGLGDRVEIRLQDYRDVEGRFDRIASIEMFEAVGESHWPVFFRSLRDRLAPGGTAALQIITIADDRFESYRGGADFIQRYIFPGGMLPSPARLADEIRRAGLHLTETRFFGPSYARTLSLWSQRFQRAWPDIAAQGFDARFRRMWEYYLAYCEAGFRAGTIDVGHFRIEGW